MSVTIKDIAKELGVSYSSISRALNGKEGVSEENRLAIIEAAERMGYQPNELARGLVNKVSNSVGVIIPDINNPYFGEVVKGILDDAKEHGYNVFLCTTDWNVTTEKEYYNTLLQKRVDGIIVKPVGKDSTIKPRNTTTPLLIIDPQIENCKNQVVVDNEMGGYLAVNHLLQCGYRQIAFILGKEDNLSSQQRLGGATRALQENGLLLDPDLVIEGSMNIEGGRTATEKLMSRGKPIDAIFGINDLIALGALQYCTEHEMKVPEEIGVIGYDNISYASLPQIQLTTVHQPKYELGRMLFETLFEEIQNKDEDKGIQIRLQPEIIERKTTRTI